MTRRVDDRWCLPFEGLLSALLTCLIPLLLPPALDGIAFLLPGLIFGIAISAHVRVFRAVRSARNLIGFIATCAVGYGVSVIVTIWSPIHPQFLNFSGSSSAAIDSSPFLTGGFVGGAFVCAGVFFFLTPPRGVRKFLLRACSISMICGLLGVLGWSVGEQLWAARWLPRIGKNLDSYTLYIIWQTGAASLLALLFSPRQTVLAVPAGAQPENVPLLRKTDRTFRSVAGTTFLAFIFGALAWFVMRLIESDLTTRRMQAARQAAQQRLAAERPSMRDLPAIIPLPVEQVLVLQPIAGHPCGLHTLAPRPTGSPESVGYVVGYKLSETATRGELHFADVEVRQYPNAAWATYQTMNFMWDLVAQNPKAVTTVTKFGNKVIMNRLMRYPNGGGDLYFYWASGNWFVRITFNVSEDDEFLKEYLTRYPSTL